MKKLFIVTVLLNLHVNAQNMTEAEQKMAPNQQSFFNRNQNITTDGTELYESNLEMKAYKKFGIGITLGGMTGLLGLNAEINLDPTEALNIGMGMGLSYRSFNLDWKHNFLGNYLSPYTKVGYAKWFNTAGNSSSTGDSDILRRVLSENEIKNNRFGVDFIGASAGLEYNQLEGELSGVNFFGEILLMAEVEKFTIIPSGAVGLIYYY